MKHFTLIFLIFSVSQIGLAQQKCLYNKDGVLFYLTFKPVSEKYNYRMG